MVMKQKKLIFKLSLVVLALLLFMPLVSASVFNSFNTFFTAASYKQYSNIIDFMLYFLIFYSLCWLGFTKWFSSSNSFGSSSGESRGAIIGLSLSFSLIMSFGLVLSGKFSVIHMFPIAKNILFFAIWILIYALFSNVVFTTGDTASGKGGNWANKVISFILATICVYLLANIALGYACNLEGEMDDPACQDGILTATNSFFKRTIGVWFLGDASDYKSSSASNSKSNSLGSSSKSLAKNSDSKSSKLALCGLGCEELYSQMDKFTSKKLSSFCPELITAMNTDDSKMMSDGWEKVYHVCRAQYNATKATTDVNYRKKYEVLMNTSHAAFGYYLAKYYFGAEEYKNAVSAVIIPLSIESKFKTLADSLMKNIAEAWFGGDYFKDFKKEEAAYILEIKKKEDAKDYFGAAQLRQKLNVAYWKMLPESKIDNDGNTILKPNVGSLS